MSQHYRYYNGCLHHSQWGVPYYALGLSAGICCLAYMNVSTASKTVFGYFVNLVSIFGLLTWVSILVSHIYFVKARRAQGVPDDSPLLRYKSPFGLWGSYFALAFCVLISLTKNFNVFRHGEFDYKVSNDHKFHHRIS